MPIATSFGAARDAVVSSVDEKFSEWIRLSPMKNGATDPSRPQRNIQAMLRTGAKSAHPVDGSNGRGWNARIAAGKGELRIDRTVYPDIALSAGDAIRAIDRPDKPLFEVAHVDDRNHVRLIVALNQK